MENEMVMEKAQFKMKQVWKQIREWLVVIGPGLIVMLADTDAGCLITAAQSGNQFGYAMVLPQLVLIPVLFMVQEITVRLGIITKKGHGELIREYFGKKWAYVSAITLLISVIGAMITEFIGIAGVGELFGISRWITIPATTMFLIGIALIGSYHRVEQIGIAFGIFELMFIIGIFMVHPNVGEIFTGMGKIPFGNQSYVFMVAANVGAVIMPWMIFYQQSAVIDKKLKPKMIKKARVDTLVGTFITQGIMIGFVILFAVTTFSKGGVVLETVSDLVHELALFIGPNAAKAILGSSLFGGAIVAAIVVALAGTWGMTEVLNWRHSLNEKLSKHNYGFYGMYAAVLIIPAAMVLFMDNMVEVAVSIEVMNALMIPIVLGFLLLLEARALPEQYRMHGIYKWTVIISSLIVMAFGFYMLGPSLNLW